MPSATSIPLPMLAKAFRQPTEFTASKYKLLPFRFLRWGGSEYFLSNLVGEYAIVPAHEFTLLVEHKLQMNSEAYKLLKSKQILYDGVSDVALDLLAVKYRTRLAGLKQFTSLHLFVTTLRCDHSCPYCQVSRVSQDRAAYDMSEETADKAIDLMFRSPSPYLKVEFQGGESLLNFDLIRYVVRETKSRNDGRDLQFVIATNLSPLTDQVLEFCRAEHVYFSTSLDGPKTLHNANRPRPDRDSYERAVSGIKRVRDWLGHDSVSALMTTTARSLDMPSEIIDEYVQQGFRSEFLRPISPFGFAVKSAAKIGYETAKFLDFYRAGLNHILDLNRRGTAIREEYSAIVLRKMLTPYSNSYLDLASPSALGIGVMVYNYNGDVYASDEGRMLAETGDHTFRLGNVHQSTWEALFHESSLLDLTYSTMTEGIPMCSECAYQPWCGTDPVYHHATQGDTIGHRPSSGWCKRQMGVFRTLVEILERGDELSAILKSWAY